MGSITLQLLNRVTLCEVTNQSYFIKDYISNLYFKHKIPESKMSTIKKVLFDSRSS